MLAILGHIPFHINFRINSSISCHWSSHWSLSAAEDPCFREQREAPWAGLTFPLGGERKSLDCGNKEHFLDQELILVRSLCLCGIESTLGDVFFWVSLAEEDSPSFCLRKIHPEVTSMSIFLYFVCGLPLQHGRWWTVRVLVETKPGPPKQSTPNLTTRPEGLPLFFLLFCFCFFNKTDFKTEFSSCKAGGSFSGASSTHTNARVPVLRNGKSLRSHIDNWHGLRQGTWCLVALRSSDAAL